MADGLGEAVSRFNESEPQETPPEEQPTEEGGGTGHTFTIHKHKNGKHHLMVHGDGGLTHHSEHDSLDEAAEEMKQHGEG